MGGSAIIHDQENSYSKGIYLTDYYKSASYVDEIIEINDKKYHVVGNQYDSNKKFMLEMS